MQVNLKDLPSEERLIRRRKEVLPLVEAYFSWVHESAMIYSLEETAKANNLKIYEYLEYLLTEIPRHMDDTDLTFVDDLLPWSEALPQTCRKTK